MIVSTHETLIGGLSSSSVTMALATALAATTSSSVASTTSTTTSTTSSSSAATSTACTAASFLLSLSASEAGDSRVISRLCGVGLCIGIPPLCRFLFCSEVLQNDGLGLDGGVVVGGDQLRDLLLHLLVQLVHDAPDGSGGQLVHAVKRLEAAYSILDLVNKLHKLLVIGRRFEVVP